MLTQDVESSADVCTRTPVARPLSIKISTTFALTKTQPPVLSITDIMRKGISDGPPTGNEVPTLINYVSNLIKKENLNQNVPFL